MKKKYKSEIKSKTLPVILVSKDQEDRIRSAAQASGESYAVFARRILLAAADAILNKKSR